MFTYSECCVGQLELALAASESHLRESVWVVLVFVYRNIAYCLLVY